MSRSGYTDDFGDEDPLAMGRYRQAVKRAIEGKRGQAMLRELLAALDAMPEKWLAAESLVTVEVEFCTLGVLGAARGIQLAALDPDEPDQVARAFGIAESMAREIVYENDEGFDAWKWVDLVGPPTHGQAYYGHPRIRVAVENPGRGRWEHMRKWVVEHLTPPPTDSQGSK